MRPVLVFDRDRCLACRSCELACSVEHSASAELESAIAEEFPPTRRVALAAGADGLEALRCEQCLEPLCAFACKSGALRRDPATGRVMLDDARCVGCYMCLMVCPFGIRPDPARDRVVRCDVCEGRATPACVEACPTGAIHFGDLNDSASVAAKEAAEPESFRLLEKLNTQPKIYYRSKKDWVREIAAAPRPGGKENSRG